MNQKGASTAHCEEHEFLGPESVAVESMQAWQKCVKNPGHVSFIPVNEFGKHHLPLMWQREDLVEMVKLNSTLTVRLRISWTSSDRPGNRWIFGGGRRGVRVGTGFLYHVGLTKLVKGCCPCAQCKVKPQIDKLSYTFAIATAKHVVFDDCEAENTFVDFFFDDTESRKNGRMKSLQGVKIIYSEYSKDRCEFTCISHDHDLAAKMKDCLAQYRRVCEGLPEAAHRFGSIKSRPMIIVSHPHGRPKQVTVGEFREITVKGLTVYSYSTDTCPGSSGARVLWSWDREFRGDNHVYARITHCRRGLTNGYNEGFPDFVILPK